MNPDNNPQYPNQQTPAGSGLGQVYGPPGYQSQPPKPPEPYNYGGPSSPKKTKKILIILGGIIGIFILVAIIALSTGGGGKDKTPPVEQTSGAQDLYKEPTAVEIENLNNSVSDDITNLSTDTDFPADKLLDENLSL